jgi:hypothetical protein
VFILFNTIFASINLKTGAAVATSSVYPSDPAAQFILSNSTGGISQPPLLSGGQAALLQSVANGLFCRVASDGALVCDATSAALATPLVYDSATGGFTYAGRPLVVAPSGAVVVAANAAATTAAAVVLPAGPPLAPGSLVDVSTATGIPVGLAPGSPQGVASSGGAGGGFMVQPAGGPGSSSSSILPGQLVLLQSNATGAYCRLVPPGQILTCDASDPGQATPLTYNGTTFLHNGAAISAAGEGQPATAGGSSQPAVVVRQAGPPLAPLAAYRLVSTNAAAVATSPSALALATGGGGGSGASAADWFLFRRVDTPWSTAPITPGSDVVLGSVATGAHCRAALLPSPGGVYGLACDAASDSSATVLQYTGQGLALAG